MPVRYFLGPIVDVTLNGRPVRGSACLRYYDGPPARVSIVKRGPGAAGAACLARFERLEFQFTSGGNTFEPYLLITGVE